VPRDAVPDTPISQLRGVATVGAVSKKHHKFVLCVTVATELMAYIAYMRLAPNVIGEEAAMKTEVAYRNLESGRGKKRALRMLMARMSRRWTPALAAFVATVRAERMDELEHLHDIYSLD
jgi:hypothetical protein